MDLFLPNILALFVMALNQRLNKPRRWESLQLGVLLPVLLLLMSVNTKETVVISEAVPSILCNILYSTCVSNVTH